MTQETFEKAKSIMIRDLEENNQDAKVIQTLKEATSFPDLKNAIDNYWGWEDEQTVWLLEKILMEL